MSQTAAAPPPAPLPEARLAGLIFRLGLFCFALLLAWLVTTLWTRFEGAPGIQTTDDAYLQTDLTPLSAKVGGYVAYQPVNDYQRVAAGQLIVQIDDRDFRAAVAQAAAGVAQAQAAIADNAALQQLQQSNIAAAQAVVRASQAGLTRNRREASRQAALNRAGAGTQQQQDTADEGFQQITAQLDGNRAQAEAATRQLDVLAAQQKQFEAQLQAAQAQLTAAQLNLGYTRITAPEAGTVGQRLIRPGQYLSPGQQVLTLAALPNLWVIANYKETQLAHLAIGQRATITVDSFPGKKMRGHVVAYAPASGSQFALLPPDNATGNFTKVVQRISVKIALDDTAGLTDLLRPGMSVITRVDMR